MSFDLFVNDWASLTGFDERQFARVDLTTNTAGAFDVGAGVLFNAYVGTDGGPLPNPFRHYEFDISPFVAASGNYRIRFLGHNVISSGIPAERGRGQRQRFVRARAGHGGLAAAVQSRRSRFGLGGGNGRPAC